MNGRTYPISELWDGIDTEILRTSLVTFLEGWDSPEMRIYDDYDVAKAKL